MKDWDAGEWIVFVLIGIFGAFVGLVLVFFGWFSLATEYDVQPWVGWLAAVLCPLVFCALFLVIYLLSEKGGESFGESLFADRGDALLFGRRLVTIVTLPLALWFIWALINAF
jgi:hypothetical protein